MLTGGISYGTHVVTNIALDRECSASYGTLPYVGNYQEWQESKMENNWFLCSCCFHNVFHTIKNIKRGVNETL